MWPGPRPIGPRWLAALLSVGLLAAAMPPSVQAQEYRLPPNGDSVVGGLQWVTATYEDTLLDIARRYDVGYREIRLANPGVDVWLPGQGAEILIPSRYVLPAGPRKGIVINLSEMRLYYYPKPAPGQAPRVITYPISIGRVEWRTPLADTRVVKKVPDPTWYPPESVRAEHAAEGDPLPKKVSPGPDNPLGRFALRLALPGYLIHGTNKPYGIGMRVSHGCIRLYPEDIEVLFKQVSVGTPVRIVNQPYKSGWRHGVLFLEAHPPEGNPTANMLEDLTPAVRSVVAATPDAVSELKVDWPRVETVAKAMTGIPLPVSSNRLQAGKEAIENDKQTARQPTVNP
jgi:L,D-transpeptidase ErfK/SrfK